MGTELTPSEFETIMRSLEALATKKVSDLATAHVPSKGAEAFATAIDRLSPNAARHLAARAVLAFIDGEGARARRKGVRRR